MMENSWMMFTYDVTDQNNWKLTFWWILKKKSRWNKIFCINICLGRIASWIFLGVICSSFCPSTLCIYFSSWVTDKHYRIKFWTPRWKFSGISFEWFYTSHFIVCCFGCKPRLCVEDHILTKMVYFYKLWLWWRVISLALIPHLLWYLWTSCA